MKFNLTNLTGPEIDLIGNTLAARPWGEVNALVLKLMAQVKAQQDAAAAPAEKPSAAAPDGTA